MKRSVPGGKFAIARGYERAAVGQEFGMAGGIARKDVFEGGPFGDFNGVLGLTDYFFEAAEEEHGDANGWRSLFHEEIVTRAEEGG